MRLNVEHVTAGDQIVLAGKLSDKPARLELTDSKAELVTDAGREAGARGRARAGAGAQRSAGGHCSQPVFSSFGCSPAGHSSQPV